MSYEDSNKDLDTAKESTGRHLVVICELLRVSPIIVHIFT